MSSQTRVATRNVPQVAWWPPALMVCRRCGSDLSPNNFMCAIRTNAHFACEWAKRKGWTVNMGSDSQSACCTTNDVCFKSFKRFFPYTSRGFTVDTVFHQNTSTRTKHKHRHQIAIKISIKLLDSEKPSARHQNNELTIAECMVLFVKLVPKKSLSNNTKNASLARHTFSRW